MIKEWRIRNPEKVIELFMEMLEHAYIEKTLDEKET